MKIIDQYIHAIGQKLPMKGREDIKKELHSLLLDDIESRYGSNPSEEQVKEVITAFGKPGEAARRYTGENPVIAPALREFYFMILAIMLGAMAIAFVTVYLVQLFTGDPQTAEPLKALLKVPLNVFNAFLSGTGSVTLIFILITRFNRGKDLDREEDWTPDSLKSIVLDTDTQSKGESIFSIIILGVLIILMNLYPELLTRAEDLFLRSGLALGHRINIESFRVYILILSFLWAAEIGYNGMLLYRSTNSRRLKAAQMGINLASMAVHGFMIGDSRLYLDSTGLIGFKIIFIIVLVVETAELLVQAGKMVLKKIA